MQTWCNNAIIAIKLHQLYYCAVVDVAVKSWITADLVPMNVNRTPYTAIVIDVALMQSNMSLKPNADLCAYATNIDSLYQKMLLLPSEVSFY